MEPFYRKLRKKLDILMDHDSPLGGKWNYDATNRRKLKPDDLPLIPTPLIFDNPVGDILQRLNRHQVSFIGASKDTLALPADREQSLALLEYCFARVWPKNPKQEPPILLDYTN